MATVKINGMTTFTNRMLINDDVYQIVVSDELFGIEVIPLQDGAALHGKLTIAKGDDIYILNLEARQYYQDLPGISEICLTPSGMDHEDRFAVYLHSQPNGVMASGEGGAVNSVNKVGPDASGNVVLTKSNIGLGNVDNTSDANKPISALQQAALDALMTAYQNADSQLKIDLYAELTSSLSELEVSLTNAYEDAIATLRSELMVLIGDGGTGPGFDVDVLVDQITGGYTTAISASYVQISNEYISALSALKIEMSGDFISQLLQVQQNIDGRVTQELADLEDKLTKAQTDALATLQLTINNDQTSALASLKVEITNAYSDALDDLKAELLGDITTALNAASEALQLQITQVQNSLDVYKAEVDLTDILARLADLESNLEAHIQADADLYQNLYAAIMKDAQDVYEGSTPLLDMDNPQVIIGTGGLLTLTAGGNTWTAPQNGAVVLVYKVTLLGISPIATQNGTQVFGEGLGLLGLGDGKPITIKTNGGDVWTFSGSLGLLASFNATFYPNK